MQVNSKLLSFSSKTAKFGEGTLPRGSSAVQKIVLAVLFLLTLASPVMAERVYKDEEYLAFVSKAGAPETIDWAAVRSLYVETSFYDPYGGAQAVWYNLQRAAQLVVDDPSPGNLANYKTLLKKHFAHYRAHLQAVDFVNKTGSTQVNRDYHENALKGILRAIRATGDGRTPETAFQVIDPAEEQMILKTFHYRPTGQDFRQKDGHFWDVLKYNNPQTNTDGEMFFNVDTILMASNRNKQ